MLLQHNRFFVIFFQTIMKVSVLSKCYQLKPKAEADNTYHDQTTLEKIKLKFSMQIGSTWLLLLINQLIDWLTDSLIDWLIDWLSDWLERFSGADPGFFLGGGAPLRNDVTDGEVKKKNLKSNTYIRRGKLHLRGVHTPCTLPLDPPLVFSQVSKVIRQLLWFWFWYGLRLAEQSHW